MLDAAEADGAPPSLFRMQFASALAISPIACGVVSTAKIGYVHRRGNVLCAQGRARQERLPPPSRCRMVPGPCRQPHPPIHPPVFPPISPTHPFVLPPVWNPGRRWLATANGTITATTCGYTTTNTSESAQAA